MDISQPTEPRKLVRVLGPWMATAIVIGTVIGSGVFKKPHAVAKDMATFEGDAVVAQADFALIMMAWVLIGVLSFIGSLILAEIAVVHPRAGGNYVFLREGYGRWAGFLWGWVEFWIIRSGSIAALAGVFSESFFDILSYASDRPFPVDDSTIFWARQGVTVTVIAVLAGVNACGTVVGGGLQLLVTSVKVLTLLSIALAPIVWLALVSEPNVQVDRLEPIWPESASGINWSKFGSALVGILWAYHGWMNLAPMAEEIKEPHRNLPLSFLMGTLAVIVLYLSVNVAYHLVVPREEMIRLGGTSPVATLFANRLIGQVGLLLGSVAIMISVFGALNGNLLVGPRLLFAMGHDGLAPSALCRLHPRFGTPLLAGIVLAGWAILLVLGAGLLGYFRVAINGQLDRLDMLLETEALTGTAVFAYFHVTKKALFDVLTDYTMFGAVAFETLSVATIFVVRRQFPVGKFTLPYRCWGYPVLPIVYVAVMAAVLGNMFYTQRTESIIAVAFIGVGALVYFLLFGRRTNEPARVLPRPAPEAIAAGEPPARV